MNKKTIKDADVEAKTVLVRVDYNVPFDIDGQIEDLYRLKGSLPTIRYLLERNCKVILMSHLGRPKGKPVAKYSLRPVATALSKLLHHDVAFVSNCVGDAVEATVKNLKPKQILLLENLRFHPEEEANDSHFAKQLANLAELYVQDAFGNSHRRHASMDAITHFIPAVAGLLIEREFSVITNALENPQRPFVAIIGGAKVSDKIELIDNLVKRADHLVIGGAMANTFFLDKHYNLPIGRSIHEEHMKPQIMAVISAIKAKFNITGDKLQAALHNFLVLPEADVVVAKAVNEEAASKVVKTVDVEADDFIVDYGPKSLERVTKLVQWAHTVVWNGPLGVTEIPQFAKASVELAKSIAHTNGETILAGGDTAAFVDNNHLLHMFDHVSTGGGAALELMAGKPLPAIEVLPDKTH